MRNKASLLLAALLAFPAVANAQTPPPVPPVGGPTAPTAPSGQHMRHHMTWSPADMAAMKAQMAKMQAQMAKAEAAHKATRAKILAALTPAHKAYLANLIGQLAVAANPDPKAATAKLDSILTASEKSKILAIHSAALAQMMSQMKMLMPPMGMGPVGGGMMRMKRTITVTNDNGTTTSTSSSSSAATPAGMPVPPMPMVGGDHRVTMFMMDGPQGMKHTRHTMTAGEILMHLAGGPHEMGAPMMLRAESFGNGRHPHPMAPLTPPVAPVAPVTPAPQATP